MSLQSKELCLQQKGGQSVPSYEPMCTINFGCPHAPQRCTAFLLQCNKARRRICILAGKHALVCRVYEQLVYQICVALQGSSLRRGNLWWRGVVAQKPAVQKFCELELK